MDQVWTKKDYLFKLRGSPGWETSIDDKKVGLIIKTKKTEHDINAVHAIGNIKHNIRDVYGIIHDPEYKKEYDKDVEISKVLKKICANTYYLYNKTKAMTFVSARDFVLVHHVH